MPAPARRTRALAVLVVALLSTGTAAAAPRPAPRPDPGRATFGVQPATATGPDARPYLSYAVTPGASLDDHVAVVNYSLRPLTLRVYATDALNDDRGGFGLLGASATPVDAGSWIAVGHPGGQGTVTVPGQSRVVLPVRVSIPPDASPGDHVGGVVVSLGALGKGRAGVNVLLDQRVAVRVYLRVSGAVRAELQIERLRVAYQDVWAPWGAGRATVTFRVRNVGNARLGGRPLVRVQGPLGSTSTVHLPDFQLLLPGSHVDLSVRLRHVWPQTREAATAEVVPLVLPGDVDPGLRTSRASTHFWAVPWTQLALPLLMGLLWPRLRRPRHRFVPAPLAAVPALEVTS